MKNKKKNKKNKKSKGIVMSMSLADYIIYEAAKRAKEYHNKRIEKEAKNEKN